MFWVVESLTRDVVVVVMICGVYLFGVVIVAAQALPTRMNNNAVDAIILRYFNSAIVKLS